MSERPRCAPAVVATLAELAPSRVRRKLDRQSDVAADWPWQRDGDEWTVSAGQESVRLRATAGVVPSVDDVTCTCLLSPRCFHALACVSVLDLDDTGEPEDDAPETAAQRPAEPAAGDPATVLDEAGQHAAELAWAAGAALLATGARAAGSLVQAGLLRAVHECRARGLHRLAAAGLRTVHSVRQARRDDPAFGLDALARDLAEHLACARQLGDAAPGAEIARELLGTARRRYHEIPGQRLYGLLGEPVLTRSGYAGVVTYLVSPDRRILTLSNVAPGDQERVAEAWLGGVSLGDLAISHRDLSRSGLFVQQGTASADGRLGAGQACRAVTASSCPWHQPPLADLFATPVAEQVSAVFERAASSPGRGAPEPAGADLLFLRGRIRGYATGGVALELAGGGGRILLQAPAQGPRQPSRDNLDTLARAPGLALRCVVRLMRHRAGVVQLLAIGGDEGGDDEDPGKSDRPSLVLDGDRAGRLSCGLERLDRDHLTSAHRRPQAAPDGGARGNPADGLDPLDRILGQLALGGRHSLPHGSVRRRDRDAARLGKSGLPTASALLESLSRQALKVKQALDGVRFPSDPAPLATGWLAAMCYTHAARAAFQRRVWLASVEAEP